MNRPLRWPGTSINTAKSLRTVAQRQAIKNAGVAKVTSAMKRGATLHCSYTFARVVWKLSTGMSVNPGIAELVIRNPHIVDAEDGLFPGGRSQTWRYREDVP